jgi:N-acetylglucosaminyldiphosphoundecaprenol N-acetyl-beta-D-mannosaminyltransferase
MFQELKILETKIDTPSFEESLRIVEDWGIKRQAGFICFANVHMLIEAYNDISFRDDLQKASLILPDGKPLTIVCKWFYKKKQERIAGMDFMPALLARINKSGHKIFLYGSTEDVLRKLIQKIEALYPNVKIAGSISPPFRKLNDTEISQHIKQINDAGSNFVLISLGCPKQEQWMARHFKNISGILLGVGGAFPVIAGTQKRCPKWMRDYSLEWLYRLLQEPRRLFKRYFVTNSIFIFLIFKQWFSKSLSKDNEGRYY